MLQQETGYRNGDIVWRDRKRRLWFLSAVSPGIPLIACCLTYWTGNPIWTLAILGEMFILVPLLDWLLGEDAGNPPDEVVAALSRDQWYRWLLFVSIPIAYASFFFSAWLIGSFGLPIWAYLAVSVGTGVASGAMLTVGHELGHKPSRLDQFGSRLACALTGYSHFCIEHNRGHHVMVATPEDPASARYNESVYRFALREIPGAAVRGWRLERRRLAAKGLPFWHRRNELLQGYAIAIGVAALVVALWGVVVLPFLVIHHVTGWLQLTFANYVEHYGLKRQRKADGRYEPCEPRHSWNTNHLVSNLMLFHLQRHSDHHANPLRPYQALRDFKDLPRLPSGYPGSYLLASIPPLWFKVMNPKLRDWAGGDMSRVNRG